MLQATFTDDTTFGPAVKRELTINEMMDQLEAEIAAEEAHYEALFADALATASIH